MTAVRSLYLDIDARTTGGSAGDVYKKAAAIASLQTAVDAVALGKHEEW
jgi:hypothetical protein